MSTNQKKVFYSIIRVGVKGWACNRAHSCSGKAGEGSAGATATFLTATPASLGAGLAARSQLLTLCGRARRASRARPRGCPRTVTARGSDPVRVSRILSGGRGEIAAAWSQPMDRSELPGGKKGEYVKSLPKKVGACADAKRGGSLLPHTSRLPPRARRRIKPSGCSSAPSAPHTPHTMRKDGSHLKFVVEFVHVALCAGAPCQCTRVLTPCLCVPPPRFRLGLGFSFRRCQ